MTTKDGAANAATDHQLLRQYILEEALAAQTITGTIKGVGRWISTTAGNGTPAIRVAKCASDGSGVTEILAIQNSSRLTVPPATTTSLTNRRYEQGSSDFSLDLTSTAVSAGDFLIVEIGYLDNTTNTGRMASANFGDDSASDLPEDETTTTADNPWIEFSMDIAFDAGGADPEGSLIAGKLLRGGLLMHGVLGR
jgi:hypothetical protein